MKRIGVSLVLPLVAVAHMVSISTGEIRLEGRRGSYEFRLPLYEVVHVQNVDEALAGAVRFSSGGAEARRLDFACRTDEGESAIICRANYEFAGEVEVLEAVSSFHTITVPNHVHLLRASRDGKIDQAVLDLSFPRAQLRFRPPTTLEVAFAQSVAGALRAAGGAAQWLFLGALVVAARSRRELMLLAAMFVAGEVVSALALPVLGWQPAPRFVEAACALTVAYLAVEVLLLPKAGQRWLVVGVLGMFHGLYFALFIQTSQYRAGWVLGGAIATELLLIALLALLLSRLERPLRALKPVPSAAAVLLVVGLSWFFLRLKG